VSLPRVTRSASLRPQRKKDELNAMVFRPHSAFEAAPITVRDHLPLEPLLILLCESTPVPGCKIAEEAGRDEDDARVELAKAFTPY
jgi:hypothetical protein